MVELREITAWFIRYAKINVIITAISKMSKIFLLKIV